jgi:hypothetical protein
MQGDVFTTMESYAGRQYKGHEINSKLFPIRLFFPVSFLSSSIIQHNGKKQASYLFIPAFIGPSYRFHYYYHNNNPLRVVHIILPFGRVAVMNGNPIQQPMNS